MFQEERPNWRQELAETPPRMAPGAHVFDVSLSDVAAGSARSASSRGIRESRLGTDFQGAARRGGASVEEETPGEMPPGTLDAGELERELSRAKLTFDDDGAQKQMVMPVLPSATRLSNIKDFDEAIFWTLRRGIDPTYAPKFMPGLSATQMATEIFNAVHEAAVEGKPYPFPIEMNDFVVLAVCSGALGAEVFESGSQAEQKGGARFLLLLGADAGCCGSRIAGRHRRELGDSSQGANESSLAVGRRAASSCSDRELCQGDRSGQSHRCVGRFGHDDLQHCLGPPGQTCGGGLQSLAEERINNFRSHPLGVLAVAFEKLMHNFIFKIRSQCRKLILGVERSRKSTQRPHIFPHLRMAMHGRDEHRSRTFSGLLVFVTCWLSAVVFGRSFRRCFRRGWRSSLLMAF